MSEWPNILNGRKINKMIDYIDKKRAGRMQKAKFKNGRVGGGFGAGEWAGAE